MGSAEAVAGTRIHVNPGEGQVLMLESLRIKNFQCHAALEVAFDERVTTIVGRSDVGKSAVLRALRWLCFNRPSGDGFLRHGADGARALLRADGKTVRRSRGKGGNVYRVEGETFKAFGHGVPDAVAGFLNLSEALNFQGQHDPPFWLAASPGEVSKELNKIIALDLIDSTLANLAREERKAKLLVELTEERLREAKEKESRLAWVEECQKDLEGIAALEEVLARKTSVQEALSQAIMEGEGLENASRQAKKIAGKLGRDLEKLEGRARCVGEQEKQVQALRSLTREVERGEGELCSIRREAKKLEVGFKAKLGAECPLCGSPLR